MKLRTLLCSVFALAAVLVAIGPAHAQEAPAYTLPETTVTAPRYNAYDECIKSAKNAFDRARCGLDKIGAGTGFGETLKPDQDQTFYNKFAQIANIVIGLVGIIAAIYLIYSGIKWMRSGGNEQMITEAKEGIRDAVIGLLVIFISYILVNFVVTQLIAVIKA